MLKFISLSQAQTIESRLDINDGTVGGSTIETPEARVNRRNQQYIAALAQHRHANDDARRLEATQSYIALLEDCAREIGSPAERDQAKTLRFAVLKNLGMLQEVNQDISQYF